MKTTTDDGVTTEDGRTMCKKSGVVRKTGGTFVLSVQKLVWDKKKLPNFYIFGYLIESLMIL